MNRPSYHNSFARSAGESKYPNLWRGLVGAYIPMLGVTGATVYDKSPKRLDGTINGATWQVQSLNFNASGQEVNLPSQTLSTFTAVIRVKVTSYNSGWAIVLGKTNNTNNFIGLNSSSGIRFRPNGGTDVDVAHSYTLGTIETWVVTFEGTTVKVYVDGVFKGQGTTTGTELIFDSLGNPYTGTTLGLLGNIYTHYLYDRVLTDNEIIRLHVDPLAPFQLADNVIGFVAPVVGGFQPAWANRVNTIIGGGINV